MARKVAPSPSKGVPCEISREHRDGTGKFLPGGPQEWKPGQSGNPGGRPASEREVTEAARKLMIEGVQMLGEIMRDRKAQAVARVRAVEILAERGYGKAPQKVIVETDVAGMNNSALSAFIRAKLEEAARTIEGEAEP